MASFCSNCTESPTSTSFEKRSLLSSDTRGTHKIHYNAEEDWDFVLETMQAIDMSLVLPHYRARLQPVDHRLSMFAAGDSAPIKLKVCRSVSRSRFYLEIRAMTSDVTVWLPSDFKGRIRHQGKPSFSAGFVNRMLKNVHFNDDLYERPDADEVLISTQGTVTFRMWDVYTNAPENLTRETWKRMFGCARHTPEISTDWDYLLEG